jgi:hypothetical protein
MFSDCLIDLSPIVHVTDKDFELLKAINDTLSLERYDSLILVRSMSAKSGL